MRNSLHSTGFAAMPLLAIALMVFLSSSCLHARQQERPHARAWLGVTIRDVTREVASDNKLPDESGAYVSDVAEHSPADSAGVEKKDIIVKFGKKDIDDADDLMNTVAKSKVGEKISLEIVRRGERKNVEVVLGKFPRRIMASQPFDELFRRVGVFSSGEHQGMQVMELNDQLGEYFGVPNGTGVLVQRVKKGSAAEKAGIKAGDVLLKIGKRTIDDMEDVSKAFSRYDEGDKVDVEVLRKGANKTFTLDVEEDHDAPSFQFFGRGPGGDEMFTRPPFQEYHFDAPQWNGNDFKYEFRDFRPDMRILEQNLRNMERSFKNQQRDLLESGRKMSFRGV